MARHGISGDEVKKRLQSFRDKLRECIEPQFGLLDRLLTNGVLIAEEYGKLSENLATSQQSNLLLDFMRRKTPEQCEQFLDGLKSTGQKHVLNFIVQNACRFNCDHTEFFNWPLEEIHIERIRSNWSRLVDEMDCEYTDLIDRLYSRQCINHEQDQILTGAARTSADMNRKLLKMLLRRSIKDYNEFVKCLEESGMQHVVQEFHLDIGPISSSEPSGPGGNTTSSDVTEAQDPVPLLFPLLSSLAVSSSSASAAPLKSFQELPETVAPQAPSQQADVTDSKITERKFGNLLHTLTSPPTYHCGALNGHPLAVNGVAIVGKDMYVVYKEYEIIKKYVRYDEVDGTVTDFMRIKGMRSRDVVVDSKRGMLFVCEKSRDLIWRVMLEDKDRKQFAGMVKPCGLSIADTGLLVTSPESLVMLNSHSGNEIGKIFLPKDTNRGKVRHFIESGRGTFIVCFENAVIEMVFDEKEFREIREFNSKQHELSCFHSALDSAGHLFVADYYGERICELDEGLKFQGFPLHEEQLENKLPRRLNYDKKTNRLAVGLRNGHVKIFEC